LLKEKADRGLSLTAFFCRSAKNIQPFTGPNSVTYAYTYNNNNQLTGVNIPGAGYITYSSYKWNRPEAVILPGGSKREYDYDPLMRE
jgi:YD repeat-containing protein